MSDVRLALRKAHREADGSCRVVASKALPGRPSADSGSTARGPTIPTTSSRTSTVASCGAMAVRRLAEPRRFEVDQHAGYSRRAGRAAGGSHPPLDFGSAIGSAGVYPRATYEGWEYLVEGKKTLAGMPSFGFYIKDWRTMPVYRARSVGGSPSTTRSGIPSGGSRAGNSAFRSARLDDKFWAARRLQAFTDEMLNTLISVGRFNDPQSEEMLSKFLIERRNAILRRYLPA